MSQAQQGHTVKVHYQGQLEDGTVFDSSEGREPLQFTLGQGQVIPGFEHGILGMAPGESREVRVPADQAYGDHRADRVLTVPKSDLPPDMEPSIGLRLEVRQADGPGIPVTVTSVNEDNIILDANHPLAGKDLIFLTELVEIV
ncbi:peptidylprolyl isomerase [soil metagenome]